MKKKKKACFSVMKWGGKFKLKIKYEIDNSKIPHIFEYKSRIFGVFYKAKVGGSTYIHLCLLQKKIIS